MATRVGAPSNKNAEQSASPMKYPSPDSERPYVYPGTQVLINRFGIRDKVVLNRVASAFSEIRADILRIEPIRGRFGFKHLADIHRFLFRDVFEWAGQARTTHTYRDKKRFVAPENIATEAKALFTKLRSESALKGLARQNFVSRAAYYFAEINRIHPFREGNGRTQRLFLEQLAAEAGHPLDFKRRKKSELYSASRTSVAGDLKAIEDLFEAIVS